MENKEFTAFMLALKSWVGEDNQDRNINIEINPRKDEPFKVWCWDYSLMQGKFVDNIEDIPTVEELKEIKKQNLLRELGALQ